MEGPTSQIYERQQGYVDETSHPDNSDTRNLDFSDYSYVKFPWRDSVHEYSYPRLGDTLGESKKSSSK